MALIAITVGISACHASEQELKTTKDIKSETINSHLLEPINCPAILEAYTYENRNDDGQIWLIFNIKKNSNFKPKLGDACNGDMKHLWQDIKRFEPLLEEHSPRISRITGLFGRNLNYFPVTKTYIKRFFDNKAIETGLATKLKLQDRSTLEGGLEIQRASRSFFMQSLKDYIAQEHKPIIETHLKQYGLKMGRYNGEKLQFCYRTFNRCEYLVDEPSSGANDFEFIGVAFDGWEFENDKHNDSE